MNADREVTFFVISAPSGAGKTSLCKRLLERDDKLSFSVSHTTRKPRPGEVHGVDYYFVDEAEFDEMVTKGEFLEWANVYGRKYGTSKKEIERAKREGVDLLIEIDCQGAQQLRQTLPEAVGIFIVPPSLTALWERLSARGTESEEEINKRLSIATRELADYKNFKYAVINDDFDKAVEELEAIVKAERCRVPRREAFIKKMLEEGNRSK